MGWDGLLAFMKDYPRRDVALLTFFIEHRTRLGRGWMRPQAIGDLTP